MNSINEITYMYRFLYNLIGWYVLIFLTVYTPSLNIKLSTYKFNYIKFTN